jgi:hypothetical protein
VAAAAVTVIAALKSAMRDRCMSAIASIEKRPDDRGAFQRKCGAVKSAWNTDLKTVEDIVHFIARQCDMMRLLEAVKNLSLPDCWIGAGFIRNAVWDAIHGNAVRTCDDVDVVYFDAAEASTARDSAIEAALRDLHPDTRWDVKNQARMHQRNGDVPYLNTEDAIARWPETATAIAVRRTADHLELIAPHGIGDLVALIARPTPAFLSRADVVARRICEKGWQARWPRLRILESRTRRK